MNKCIFMGRIASGISFYPNHGGNSVKASFTLAVHRPMAKEGQDDADFIRCSVFGESSAKFANEFFCKGIKLMVSGHLRTGSYVNGEGLKVYYTELIVQDMEFTESKEVNDEYRSKAKKQLEKAESDADGDEIADIPEDEETSI